MILPAPSTTKLTDPTGIHRFPVFVLAVIKYRWFTLKTIEQFKLAVLVLEYVVPINNR